MALTATMQDARWSRLIIWPGRERPPQLTDAANSALQMETSRSR
jgi:hypothetical protein